MQTLTYMRKYYPLRPFAVFLLLCVLQGCIPAILIYVESSLIDCAIYGITQNGTSPFLKYLGYYLLLLALRSVWESLLHRNAERHTILVGTSLDSQRLEKINRVPFSVTETQVFHELLEKAGKAPELDQACYKAMQQMIVGSVKMVTMLIVLLRIDVGTVVLLTVFLLAGVWIHTNAAKKADGFWGEYISNMRRANYLSSLLLHREYAMERKVFDYGREVEYRIIVLENGRIVQSGTHNQLLEEDGLYARIWASQTRPYRSEPFDKHSPAVYDGGKKNNR